VLFVGLLVFVGFNFPFVDRSCGFFVGFVCDKSAVAREKSPLKKKKKKKPKKKKNRTIAGCKDRQTDRLEERAIRKSRTVHLCFLCTSYPYCFSLSVCLSVSSVYTSLRFFFRSLFLL
jgi:hypothetical protein